MPKTSSSGDEQPTVRLKPLFGVAPRRYLPVIYVLVLVVLLFALFVLPGIVNNGELLTVRSVPAGAEIVVDGVRLGSTPETIFVKAGTHTVTVRRTNFASESSELDVRGRVLGSLLFPSRRTHRVHLTMESPQRTAEQAATEFSNWSIVGDANAHYQFPPVLSSGVIDLTSAANADEFDGAATASELIDHALADVRSTALLKDFLRASLLEKSFGTPPSGLAIGRWISDLGRRLDHMNALPVLIEESLPDELSTEFGGQSWFTRHEERRTTALLPYTREADPLASTPELRTFAGVPFRRMPAGSFVMGLPDSGSPMSGPEQLDVPHVEDLQGFYIMETEVTEAMYARFVDQVPRWRPDNRDALVREGVVSRDYLGSWESYRHGTDSNLPVVEVSYPAAAAYAEWFSNELPDSFSARLPREAEWEWSAYLNGGRTPGGVFRGSQGPAEARSGVQGAAGLYHMLGNVWEWQQNWYHPGTYALHPAPGEEDMGDSTGLRRDDAGSRLPAAHRAVRGGSWANREADISAITRGSQPPETSSPYLGFRLIVVEIP